MTAGQHRLGIAGSSLFRSKLRAPATPEHLVSRPRLLEVVDEATTVPLALVVAPAGAGKTCLLAHWTAQSGTPSAWLTVDELDRDGTQFWTGVIAALQSLLPGVGKSALAVLQRGDALAQAVGELLHELEAAPRPASVLVLDDAHLIDDDADTAASLTLFLAHLPTWLHVVLVARREPHLRIDRLRARGHLIEVRVAQLSFSQQEAEQMLALLAPSLSADRVAAAARRAGGWAASIQLTALAERSARALPNPVGPSDAGDLLIEDYVWHEVLAAESPELVGMLVDTAVVERINPNLASALTRRADAGALLGQAQARGLFIHRLDPDGWFQVHSLVRSVLIAELRRRSPAHLAEQHVRAAQWFQNAGEVLPALEHWLQAGRPREALRLLATSSAALYDSGREATIGRTLAGIPTSVAGADLAAMLEFAWCQLLVDRAGFLDSVDRLAARADHSRGVHRRVRARVTMLRSLAATMRGDWEDGGRLARQAMVDLGAHGSRDLLGRFAWNMVARDIALSERWDSSGAEVREARSELAADPERRLAFEGTHALGEALAGRPIDALRVAAGVRQAARVSNMTILQAELSIAEAIAHRELGDRVEAVQSLRALADRPFEPVPYCQLLALLELTQAGLHEGNIDAAEQAFDRATELVATQFSETGGSEWLARVGTQLELARGDLDRARRWADRVEDMFWAGASAARVALAEGNLSDAALALDTAMPRCVRHEVVLALLRARAVATQEEAVKHACAGVELAAATGLLQSVAAEGPEILRLVELAAWRAPQPWLQRLRTAATPPLHAPRVGQHGLMEPLTERELQVLRMLPSRLTLREIASELYISVNTLKFHLKLIYRKLGCSSRAEAAELARAMATTSRSPQSSNTLLR